MKKTFLILSKIFCTISIISFVCAFLFLAAHTYYHDYYFNTIHGYHNPASEFLAPNKKEMSILLVSDSGSNNLVLRDVLKDAMKSNTYDFALYVGDMTKNASVSAYYWMLNDIKPILKDTPFYTIPGNHDIVRRHGLTKKHFNDKSLYETIMGQRYYWFGYGNTLFITLDSSDETIDDEQFAWLNDTLTKIRPLFKNCIIIGHVPPINSCPECFKAHTTKPETTKRFGEIIKKHNINAMFFGHVHFYSKSKFQNIDFYTTPASGQSIRDPYHPKFGYLSVKIDKRGNVNVTPGFIDFSGPKNEFIMEWFTRDVMGTKVRMVTTTALEISIASLIMAWLLLALSGKKRK